MVRIHRDYHKDELVETLSKRYGKRLVVTVATNVKQLSYQRSNDDSVRESEQKRTSSSSKTGWMHRGVSSHFCQPT